MVTLDSSSLEGILGITPPFAIKNVIVDREQKTLKVELFEKKENSTGKTKWFPFSKPVEEELSMKMVTWSHVSTGDYKTYIQIKPVLSTFSKERNANPPVFLGAEKQGYTHLLCEKVVNASRSGVLKNDIVYLFNVDKEIVNGIIEKNIADIRSSSVNSNLNSFVLPSERDPIWPKLISQPKVLKTKNVQLGYIFTKFNMGFSAKRLDMETAISELRNFFIQNKVRLSEEYQQVRILLAGSNQEQNEAPITQTSTQPASNKINAQHEVWRRILSGDFTLMSKDSGFNFLLSKLISEYTKSTSKTVKATLAQNLMNYIKLNQNKLVKEIQVISSLTKTLKDENSFNTEIPEADHPIWQAIIAGEVKFNSPMTSFSLYQNVVQYRAPSERAGALRGWFLKNHRQAMNLIIDINQHISKVS